MECIWYVLHGICKCFDLSFFFPLLLSLSFFGRYSPGEALSSPSPASSHICPGTARIGLTIYLSIYSVPVSILPFLHGIAHLFSFVQKIHKYSQSTWPQRGGPSLPSLYSALYCVLRRMFYQSIDNKSHCITRLTVLSVTLRWTPFRHFSAWVRGAVCLARQSCSLRVCPKYLAAQAGTRWLHLRSG